MARLQSDELSWQLQILIISSLCLAQHLVSGQQPEVAPVAPSRLTKILVPSLPPDHYRFWLRNHPKAFQEFEKICSQAPNPTDLINLKYFQSLHANLSLEDPRYLTDFTYGKEVLSKICSKIDIVTKSCWGYENNCQLIYLMPECYGSQLGQAKDEQEQKIAWFSQADFGYILDRRREMGRYCSPPKYSNDSWLSSLECTKHFKSCRGQNLYIKFEDIQKNGSFINSIESYQMKSGNIGGWECDLQLKRIAEEGGQEGPLKSWFNELKNYNIISQPKGMCDITIEKQAFIIKLDSPANMYHYFGNFLNLYATIHLNNKFSEDNEIIIWDNHLPRSKFDRMWQAFSKNPLRHIGEFDGKRVCFKKFIFTLLPRMVDGLYHNTQLVPGCSKTGLFDAFNKHVLHRLNVSNSFDSKFHEETDNKVISVTLIKRSGQYRKNLNEMELETAIRAKSIDFMVRLIDYETLTFQQQLQLSRNTDILVGIHGASLTNLLFLPDWAALIELYDCGDSCYHDLARLRGVKYYTFQNKSNFITKVPIEDEEVLANLNRTKLFNNDKFSNYKVNVSEFLVLLGKVADNVKGNRLKFLQSFKENMKSKELDKIDPDTVEKGTKINEKATKPHEEL